jgi:hypothetical protein
MHNANQKVLLGGVDVLLALRRWETVALALVVSGGALFAASMAIVSQLWDLPYARGCMLIVVENTIFSLMLGGWALATLRETLSEAPHMQPLKQKAFLVLGTLICLASGYFLVIKNTAPLQAFTSCYIAYPADDVCNVRTAAASRKHLIVISNTMLELRASPWSATVELQDTRAGR